jgi:hypothetical protein
MQIDLEDFFFFLIDNPNVKATEQRYRGSEVERTYDDIERIYNNNIKWSKKILKYLFIKSIKEQILLSKKIQWIPIEKKSRELDEWM